MEKHRIPRKHHSIVSTPNYTSLHVNETVEEVEMVVQENGNMKFVNFILKGKDVLLSVIINQETTKLVQK